LTLGLLYVRPPSRKCIANVFQELVLDQALRPTCIYHLPQINPYSWRNRQSGQGLSSW
jgi:hypothetical protein